MPRARHLKELRSETLLKLEELVRYQMHGKSVKDCAELLHLSAKTVSDLLKHPDYDKVRQRVLDRIYEPHDTALAKQKASAILETAAPDAAAELAALLYSDDEVTVRQAAIALLDRSGHGPIQRKAVRQRVELDPATAALLGRAMKEADAAKPIDVEVVPEPDS